MTSEPQQCPATLGEYRCRFALGHEGPHRPDDAPDSRLSHDRGADAEWDSYDYVTAYEVEKKLGDRYRHAAARLRVALGSVRSLKLPAWLGGEVEAAWVETAFLVDPTAEILSVPAPTLPALDVEKLAGSMFRVDREDGRYPMPTEDYYRGLARAIAREYKALRDAVPTPREVPDPRPYGVGRDDPEW